MIWRPPVTLINARVVAPDGEAGSIRFTSDILALDEPPRSGDVVVDVDGAFVLPGLINAHDHLELNHYGRLKCSARYENVSEWIDDMRPRIATDATILEARGRPLSDRLFIGALKNVLSGVTTVVHHNPFYREVRRGMPLRVLRKYGWAHSFALADRPAGAKGERGGDVQERFRATPSCAPFFVHLAEGVDDRARGELLRLQTEGCLAANTVAVHAVAVDATGWRRMACAGASAVWCPASNLFLFGRTIDFAQVQASHSMPAIVLGTDSRLTGACDLLDELRIAAESCGVARAQLLRMVTSSSAAVIRQPQLGRLAAGAPADLVVLPPVTRDPVETLLATSRRDVSLVVVGGQPMVGAATFAEVFSARGAGQARPIAVDLTPKLADPLLARRIATCAIVEPGVAAA